MERNAMTNTKLRGAGSTLEIALRIQQMSGAGSRFEWIPVERLDSGLYRLRNSPGMTLGLAAGDVIRPKGEGDFDIVERGGNVCIQVFLGSVPQNERPRVREAFENAMSAMGGRLDGVSPGVLIGTVSVSATFPRIEAALKAFEGVHRGITYMFGNVYDIEDGHTPLNWWLETSGAKH